MGLRKTVWVLLLCLVAVLPASANLVVNGSFELPVGNAQVLTPANGWTTATTQYVFNHLQPQCTPAVDGDQVTVMFYGESQWLSQVIPTAAGTSYDLSFWTKGWDPTVIGPMFKVQWLKGGVNQLSDWNDFQRMPNDWTKTTITGIVAGNDDTIKFLLASDSPNHILLDDVRVVESQTAIPVSVDEAKTSALGAYVTCTDAINAVFTDFLYIERSDRTSGIRVKKAAHGFALSDVGKIVEVTGYTAEDPDTGERYIDATSIVDTLTTGAVSPEGMTNKSLGGGDYGNPGAGEGQKGVANGTGLNNIGLLVRTTGNVTKVDDSTFTLNDGSGVSVTVVHPADASLPTTNDYISVTGISSCSKDSGQIQRRLLVDENADIKVVTP